MTNEELNKRYYVPFAAEYARSSPGISEYIESDEDAIRKALEAELDIHMFKRSPVRLARIVKTIGMIKQMNPLELLEVGCGPGVFLWTLADQFPDLFIRAVDMKQSHIDRIEKVIKRDRFPNIGSGLIDLANPIRIIYRNVYDVVTCLEVLEHVPDWQSAVGYISKVARKFVIISFPSKADDNPEHIHLLDKNEVAEELMGQDGIISTKFDYVNGHTFVVARKEIEDGLEKAK